MTKAEHKRTIAVFVLVAVVLLSLGVYLIIKGGMILSQAIDDLYYPQMNYEECGFEETEEGLNDLYGYQASNISDEYLEESARSDRYTRWGYILMLVSLAPAYVACKGHNVYRNRYYK